MFYLTTHSTHFIYSHMVSDIWFRTIHIAKQESSCGHIGYSFRLTARVLLYAPSHIPRPLLQQAGTRNEERSLMVRWVVGSTLHGGPIELFLVPASAPRLV